MGKQPSLMYSMVQFRSFLQRYTIPLRLSIRVLYFRLLSKEVTSAFFCSVISATNATTTCCPSILVGVRLIFRGNCEPSFRSPQRSKFWPIDLTVGFLE